MSTAGLVRPALLWAHRGLGPELWVRVSTPVPGRLQLRRDDAHGTVLSIGTISQGEHDLAVDLGRELDGHPPPTGVWTFGLDTSAGWQALTAPPEAFRGLAPFLGVTCGTPVRVRCARGQRGDARLALEERPPWGEVEVLEQDGDRLHVRGQVIGPIDEVEHAALIDRDSGEVRILGADTDARHFAVSVPLGDLDPAAVTRTWNVSLVAGDHRVRLGRHLDDVPNKGRAVVTDPVVRQQNGRWWSITPRFTDRNNLAITVTAPAPGDGPPDPLATWTLEQAHLAADDAIGRRPWWSRLAAPIARVGFHVLEARARRARRRWSSTPRSAAPGPRRVHLLLANSWATGGTIRATVNTANALAASGDEVELVSVYRLQDRHYFPVDGTVRRTLLSDDLHAARATGRTPKAWLRRRLRQVPSVLMPNDDPRAHRFHLWSDLKLVRWTRSIRAGTIITTRAGLTLVAARFARPGVTVIAQQHVPFTTQAPALQEELLDGYRRVDAVCVLTAADEREVTRRLGAARTVVRRLPNPLDATTPAPAPLVEPRVVCGGRISPTKGTDLLLDAFASVTRDHPGWELRIYGSARRDRLDAARCLIRRHGLHRHVLLMEPTGRFDLELTKASICVVPSRHEAFGMVIIEAMHAGVPVVAFDCPTGPREIITDGEDGLLVPSEDPDALAAALVRLIEDPPLRAKLADGGRRTAAAYHPARVAARLQQLIDDVAVGS